MGKNVRRIIEIDESKCDGCGLCADACHEGAIRIVDGKARLVSDSYCDGLGDCIGECPRGAITFVEREAAPYDEEAVRRHLAARTSDGKETEPLSGSVVSGETLPCGCPGTAVRGLRSTPGERGKGCPGTAARSLAQRGEPLQEEHRTADEAPRSAVSELANWPVQLKLVPVNAPYLQGAHLVMAADCTAFAHPDFHATFLRGPNRVCLVGCPKLDDAAFYQEKIAAIIEANATPSISVIYMEVPCCGGLKRLVENAVEQVGRDLDLRLVRVGIRGEILEDGTTRYRFRRQG
jgi:NAD-dependent dihydropyrimidine dehydrogenase PreA subunit